MRGNLVGKEKTAENDAIERFEFQGMEKLVAVKGGVKTFGISIGGYRRERRLRFCDRPTEAVSIIRDGRQPELVDEITFHRCKLYVPNVVTDCSGVAFT